MADKQPLPLRCPLKIQGLMANPAVLEKLIEKPGFLTDLARQVPEAIKCEKSKCGFWSEHKEDESYEVEIPVGNGEVEIEERTRQVVVDGCAIALIPQQTVELREAIGDIGDALGVAGTFALGALRKVAEHQGMGDALADVEADAGISEGEEEEEEETEEEGAEEEQEVEAAPE